MKHEGIETLTRSQYRPKKLTALAGRFDQHTVELVTGAAVAFVLKVTGAGLMFLFNVLLARLLGAGGAGIYFLALTVTTIAAILGRLGLGNTLVRFIAASSTAAEVDGIHRVYRTGVAIALLTSAALAVTMFLLAPFLANVVFAKPELLMPLRWMAFAVLPFSLLTLHSELLKGLKQIRNSQIVGGVAVPALCLVGLYAFGTRWELNGLLLAYNLATWSTLMLGVFLWHRHVPKPVVRGRQFMTRELLHTSIPLFWVDIMNLIITWAATFALGIWGSAEDVGIFSIAARTATFFNFVIVAINTIAAPKFAELFRQGDMPRLDKTARRAAVMMTAAAIPIVLLVVTAPKTVMGLFGAEFVNGSSALVILAIGYFVMIMTGSVGVLLMMSGYEKPVRNVLIASAILHIVLIVGLVPGFGATGAAIAIALTLAIKNLLLLQIAHSRMRIYPSIFSALRRIRV